MSDPFVEAARQAASGTTYEPLACCLACGVATECGHILTGPNGLGKILCWRCRYRGKVPVFVVSFARFGEPCPPPPAPAAQLTEWIIVHTGEPRYATKEKTAGVDIVWRCDVVPAA